MSSLLIHDNIILAEREICCLCKIYESKLYVNKISNIYKSNIRYYFNNSFTIASNPMKWEALIRTVSPSFKMSGNAFIKSSRVS